MNFTKWVEQTLRELGPWGNLLVLGEKASEIAGSLATQFGQRCTAVFPRHVAGARNEKAPPWARLSIVLADPGALPFRPESYSWVVAVFSSVKLDASQPSLTELRWAVKPNGHVLLALPGLRVDDSSEKASVEKVLADAGFDVEMIRGFDDFTAVLASPAALEASDEDEALRRRIMQRLSEVIDPETGVDVVTMDMIADLRVNQGVVDLTFRPTTPYCPIAVHLSIMIKRAVQDVEGVKAVNMTVVDYVDAENLTRELRSL